MGDKSPKAVNKQTAQKQAKAQMLKAKKNQNTGMTASSSSPSDASRQIMEPPSSRR